MNPDAYQEMANTEAIHWWFRGRRAILSSVIESLNLPSNAKILEIGSGTGGNLQMLSSFGQVWAIEMDPTARAIALKKTGGRFDIRPGTCPNSIPFVGEKYNLICLFDVLEHIEDDTKTLIAVKKLIEDGGRVLVTVPAYNWLWSVHDNFLHHKRRYSTRELSQKISASGFKIAKLTHFNSFLFPIAVLMRFKDNFFNNSLASGTKIPPAPINDLFASLFKLERFMFGKFNLPFGVSLLCVLEPCEA